MTVLLEGEMPDGDSSAAQHQDDQMHARVEPEAESPSQTKDLPLLRSAQGPLVA